MSSPETQTLRRLHRRLNELRRLQPTATLTVLPGSRPRIVASIKRAVAQAKRECQLLSRTRKEPRP